MQTNIEVYTVKELQEMLKLSKGAAYNLIHQKGFPLIKLGDGALRIPAAEFKVWLESARVIQ